MSSSIFSSDASTPFDRVPHKQPLSTWVWTLLLAISSLSAYELMWRHAGLTPEIVDSPALWAKQRAEINRDDKHVVALLGLSRMQAGFDCLYAKEKFANCRFVQLACASKSPMATLEDLSTDSKFHGTVICSVFGPKLMPASWEDQRDLVEYYHREWNQNQRVNLAVSKVIQRSFVFVHPHVNIKKNLGLFLFSQKTPSLPTIQYFENRSISLYYPQSELKGRGERYLNRCLKEYPQDKTTENDWDVALGKIREMVKRIQSRGGEVVFVRFPSAPECYQIEDNYFPKKKYWDTLAESTKAVTIHFKDVPVLSRFDCPDKSHLDSQDISRFTHALLEELVQRGVLSH